MQQHAVECTSPRVSGLLALTLCVAGLLAFTLCVSGLLAFTLSIVFGL